MTEFHSLSGRLPYIPDNLSIPQFILDSQHSTKPSRSHEVPWLIEDHNGRKIYYNELHTRTHSLANAMSLKWNIHENDVVCVFSPNHIDYPVTIWAIHRLGAIVTPVNPGYTATELAYQLKATNPVLIVVYPDFLATAISAARLAGISEDYIVLFNALPNPVPYSAHATVNDLVAFGLTEKPNFLERRLHLGEAKTKLAFLSFSSGTTGQPKAVAISHFGVIANVIQMAVHNKISDPKLMQKPMVPGDIATAVLPFFHIYGLVVNMHFMLFCGMSVVVIPKFNFVQFLKSIVRHRITHLLLVPPQIVLLCKHPAVKDYDFSHVKYCMSGAAPLSGELTQKVTKILPNARIGQGYGLTETCATVAMIPPDQKVGTIGSAGQLIAGIVARVVKADGSLAREGEQGELVVTGPSMALRYLNNEQATKETFQNGWVRTGDEVIIRKGEVFVVDRIKEIMKVRGFQVAPAELEGHLLMHPAVSDACVVSIPDEYSGEIPLAYIVVNAKSLELIKKDRKEGARLKIALTKHVADAKVSYKWLAGGVEFIEAIPKNPSGKMLRRLLRDKARVSRVKAPMQAKM